MEKKIHHTSSGNDLHNKNLQSCNYHTILVMIITTKIYNHAETQESPYFAGEVKSGGCEDSLVGVSGVMGASRHFFSTFPSSTSHS